MVIPADDKHTIGRLKSVQLFVILFCLRSLYSCTTWHKEVTVRLPFDVEQLILPAYKKEAIKQAASVWLKRHPDSIESGLTVEVLS